MAPLQRGSSQPRAPIQQTIQHLTHTKHPLHRVHIQAEYNCDGCHTVGGAGFRYRCSDVCDFDLHEQCATCPLSISSHLHPNHQLILVNQPGNGFSCDACRRLVDGLFYTCQPCKLNIHPMCTQIPHLPPPLLQTPTAPPPLQPSMNCPPSSSSSSQQVNFINSPRFGMNQGFIQPRMSFPPNCQPVVVAPRMISYPQNVQLGGVPQGMNLQAGGAPQLMTNYPQNIQAAGGVPQAQIMTNYPQNIQAAGGVPQLMTNYPQNAPQGLMSYPQNVQAYNNNGLQVTTTPTNRQNNNNAIGKLVTRAVMTSIFGFPLGP